MSRFYSLDDMIGCAKRELLMHQRVYPKWVEQGRMRQDKADWEIGCMEQIAKKLSEMAGRRDQ